MGNHLHTCSPNQGDSQVKLKALEVSVSSQEQLNFLS